MLDKNAQIASACLMRLPTSALEFTRVIGLAATLRLVECAKPDRRCSGQARYRIKIPSSSLSDDHALVRTLGREEAERLRRHFAGETLPFPVRRLKKVARDISIARDFQQGIPIPVLAQHHRVSHAIVMRAVSKVSQGDIQRAQGDGTHPPLGPSGGGPVRV